MNLHQTLNIRPSTIKESDSRMLIIDRLRRWRRDHYTRLCIFRVRPTTTNIIQNPSLGNRILALHKLLNSTPSIIGLGHQQPQEKRGEERKDVHGGVGMESTTPPRPGFIPPHSQSMYSLHSTGHPGPALHKPCHQNTRAANLLTCQFQHFDYAPGPGYPA